MRVRIVRPRQCTRDAALARPPERWRAFVCPGGAWTHEPARCYGSYGASSHLPRKPCQAWTKRAAATAARTFATHLGGITGPLRWALLSYTGKSLAGFV